MMIDGALAQAWAVSLALTIALAFALALAHMTSQSFLNICAMMVIMMMIMIMMMNNDDAWFIGIGTDPGTGTQA